MGYPLLPCWGVAREGLLLAIVGLSWPALWRGPRGSMPWCAATKCRVRSDNTTRAVVVFSLILRDLAWAQPRWRRRLADAIQPEIF